MYKTTTVTTNAHIDLQTTDFPFLFMYGDRVGKINLNKLERGNWNYYIYMYMKSRAIYCNDGVNREFQIVESKISFSFVYDSFVHFSRYILSFFPQTLKRIPYSF